MRLGTIKKNVTVTFVSRGWIILINLGTLPYIVSKLGPDAYGLLVIINVIMGYLGLLDFGISPTLIKFVGEQHAKKNQEQLQKIIENLFFLSIFSGVAGGLLLFASAPILANTVLNIPISFRVVSIQCFEISAFGFFLRMLLNALTSIPSSMERVDLTASFSACIQTIGVVLQVALLYAGQGILGIVWAELFLNMAAVLAAYAMARHLMPQIKFRPSFSKSVIQSVMGFGLYVWIQDLLGLIASRLDRVLINIFLPISSVTYYAIPASITQGLNSSLDILGSSYYPAACRIFAKNDKKAFLSLLIKMRRYLRFTMLVIFLPIFFFPHALLTLWMGKAFADKSALTFLLLALAQFIACFSYADGVAARALGKPKILVFYGLIGAPLTVVLNVILIPKLGIAGAAVATLVPVAFLTPIFLTQFNLHFLKPYCEGD